MRRLLVCFTAVMVLGLSIPAKAAETGEVRVALDFGDGEVYDGSVILYQVGMPEGAYYRLTTDFGGGLIRKEDAASKNLAIWLAELGQGKGVPRILDADGTAWFTGLSDGLYLLVQNGPIQGLDPFAPMLFTMPSMGERELVLYPQSRTILAQIPATGQFFSPLLGAIGMILSGMGLVLCADRFRRK